MDEVAQERGFESFAEFNQLVADVDMSTPEKMAAFRNWSSNDGSKEGIMKLTFIQPKSNEQCKIDYVAQLKKMDNRTLLDSYTTLANLTDIGMHNDIGEFCWEAISEELETRLKKAGFLTEE